MKDKLYWWLTERQIDGWDAEWPKWLNALIMWIRERLCN